jgi:hypothetical protein
LRIFCLLAVAFSWSFRPRHPKASRQYVVFVKALFLLAVATLELLIAAVFLRRPVRLIAVGFVFLGPKDKNVVSEVLQDELDTLQK